MGTKCGYKQAAGNEGHLTNLRDFETSSMSGMAGKYGMRGQMPAHVEDQYATDAEYRDGIVYTVLSYDTPIGWVCGNGVVRVPDAYYSTTTSKHQHYTRAWLGAKGTVWDDFEGDIMRIIDLDRTTIGVPA